MQGGPMTGSPPHCLDGTGGARLPSGYIVHYLELFARYPRFGWKVRGDEAADGATPHGTVHKGHEGGSICLRCYPMSI